MNNTYIAILLVKHINIAIVLKIYKNIAMSTEAIK